MRQWLQRPAGRIILGIGVGALIAIVGGALYLFGTVGVSASNKPVTAPTLVATNASSSPARQQRPSTIRTTTSPSRMCRP